MHVVRNELSEEELRLDAAPCEYAWDEVYRMTLGEYGADERPSFPLNRDRIESDPADALHN